MRSLVLGSLLLAVSLAGCSVIAPVGTNKASFPYARPDESGKVVVSPVLSEGAASGTVTFSLGVPQAKLDELKLDKADLQGAATDCPNSAPDDASCFAVDVSALPAGIYPIDIYGGDPEAPEASETILVPTSPAAEDDAASEADE